MKVSECMSAGVASTEPSASIADAARTMREREVGFLPILEDGRVVGLVTDRDMVINALARDRGPATPVRDVMSAHVHHCFDDEDLDEAAAKMSQSQVRRLPVVNREMQLVGVISLGDIAQATDDDGERAAETLSQVTEPGGSHAH